MFVTTIWLIARFGSYPGLSTTEETIRVEIIKSLLQLAVVIIIGTIVTALFKAVERSSEQLLKEAEQIRQQSRLRAETRVDYINRLGDLYRNIKSSRRALRAFGLTTKFITSHTPISINSNQINMYREQMERINEAQLELEKLKIEAKNLPNFASLKGVPENLESMEKYVGKIVSEFEEAFPLLESKRSIPPHMLKHLEEYTGDTDRQNYGTKYRFKKHFAEPYDEVIAIISKSLVIS
jgi:hypothetical protein